MTTFNVLSPDTKIFGHYFLEASAGTGKTFAIENIVPRLILESEEPLVLSEILVVTFTRAATRELKSRIYQNLLKIKTALDARNGGPLYLEPFFTNEAKLVLAKRKIEEALCLFETAQVFTLHGFCLKILQEFAFEAKFFLSASDEEECAQKDKLKQYIKDFLRKGIDPKVLSPSQLRIIVGEVGKEIEALCDALLMRLEGGQKIASYPTAMQMWTKWNRALASFERASKKDLWHDCSLAMSSFTKYPKRMEDAERFFTWIENQQCSFEEWDAFLGEGEFFLNDLKLKKKIPDGLIHPGLFEEMKQVFSLLYKEATDFGSCLLSLASACRAHYEKGRLDLSHFNPDDLVIQLQEALAKDPVFCGQVQERYKAAVIDEFQDTDPAQWAIFETLFFKKDAKLPTLYLVGDPKQSIYAFRRADVYLYLRAASLLGETSVAYLDKNFRSHPLLVDALNEVFSRDLPSRWMLLPQESKSLEVRRVLSKDSYPSPLDGDIKGRVHFFLIEDPKESRKKWPREELEEESLLPWIAKEIHSLRKEKGYKFNQMAVLVKDRYQARRLQKVLKAFDIPCLMQKSLDVSTSAAYEVMKDLLLAAQRPSSLSALKKAAGGAFIGFSSNEILGSLENPNLQKVKELFIESGNAFRSKGLGVFFQNLLLSCVRTPDLSLGEELLSRQDPHLYFDLRQIVQILLENCPTGLYDPEVCLEFLEELRDLSPTSETLKSYLEEEEDQVQVMTLHKSKGLEFEIVFALGLCSRHSGGDAFISIRKEEERVLVSSSQEETAHSLHLQETDAEKLRQLYVALTRAKERVYVPLVVAKEPSEVDIGSASAIELFLGAVGLSEYVLEQVYQNIASLSLDPLKKHLQKLQSKASVSFEEIDVGHVLVEGSDPSKVLKLIEPPHFLGKSPDQFLLSFSSLIEGKLEESNTYIEPPSAEDLPAGSETGTVVHAILEELCKADLHRELGAKTKQMIEDLSKGSCLEGKEEKLFQMIEKAFKAPWEDGSLQEIPSCDMQVEMEFLYPFRSSFLKGFIDLVFRRDGKYYILDWKTNYLGPNEEDYLSDKVEECMRQSGYFLQASIYSFALKKYLALFEKKPFESIFGGVIYFFLRGAKPYLFKPNVKELDVGDGSWKKQ